MPGPSDAQDAVENFRAAVIQQEVKASAQVVRAYAPVYTRLQSDTRALVTIAQTRGLKPWQVMRMERLKDLERQFLANSSRFATQAGSIVTESQRAAVGLARQGALEATTAGLPRGVTMNNMANLGLGWNQLPDDAFQNFVGIAGDGAPLANLLNPLGPEAITGVREKIGEKRPTWCGLPQVCHFPERCLSRGRRRTVPSVRPPGFRIRATPRW